MNSPTTLEPDVLKSRETIEVKATDKGGTEQTYTGMPIAALLEEAGLKEGATTVVFTGGDG